MWLPAQNTVIGLVLSLVSCLHFWSQWYPKLSCSLGFWFLYLQWGNSMATELMVSCKGARLHHWILATPMNFTLQMQVLNVVGNRELVESVELFSVLPYRLWPIICWKILLNGCHARYVPFWIVAQFPCPSIVQGASCFWLPGHPSV